MFDIKRMVGDENSISASEKIGEFFKERATAKFKTANDAPPYRKFFVDSFKVLEPNTNYIHNWHVDYLCDILQEELDRIARNDKKEFDLIVNIIFRSMKSYIFTISLNAYAWVKYPWMRFITSSYAENLAIEHAMETRKLIASDYYQSNFGHAFKISKRQDDKKKFLNDKSGMRKVASVGGQVTGSGGNIISVDDPLNPKQAASEILLTRANKWWDETFYSRLNNPDVDLRMVVMQRLGNNDLTGHIKSRADEKGTKIKHIIIPAELKPNISPEGLSKFYMPSKLFFPKRFSKDVLNDYLVNLGTYGYAQQANQMTTPDGGGSWKEAWFPIIRDDLVPQVRNRITAWDLATTKKTKNSASAYVTGGIFNKKIYITDCGYDFLEFPQLRKWITSKPAPHIIENKSAGKDMVPTLKEDGINAIEWTESEEDKILKTNKATPTAENGLVILSASIADKLLKDKIQGICFFPNGVKDDLNDAFVILIMYLKRLIVDVGDMAQANKQIARPMGVSGQLMDSSV